MPGEFCTPVLWTPGYTQPVTKTSTAVPYRKGTTVMPVLCVHNTPCPSWLLSLWCFGQLTTLNARTHCSPTRGDGGTGDGGFTCQQPSRQHVGEDVVDPKVLILPQVWPHWCESARNVPP